MNFKKWLLFLMAALLLLPALVLPAAAAGDPVLRYELTVDGLETKEADVGDIVTVTLHLQRVDKDEPYTMYAMQSEIRYDSTFFELVEDSANLYSGVQSTDIAMVDHHREFYMNFVSFSGGTEWQPRTRVGSFQLRVISTKGVSSITNEDYLVSKPGGTGGYECESNVAQVILTGECTVRFETNGGSKIDDVTVIYGEKLTPPKDPTREGKTFAGWFKDIHLKEKWDFANDTVQGNMTLYAKWEEKSTNTGGGSSIVITPGTDNPTDPNEGDPSDKPTDPSTDPNAGNDDPTGKPDDPSVNDPTNDPTQKPDDPSEGEPGDTPVDPAKPGNDGKGGRIVAILCFLLLLLLFLLFFLQGKKTVRFDARGGSPVEKQKLKKGSLIEEPVDPAKPGAEFDGWYLDPELTLPWNFEESIVRKNMTFYAKWK